MNMNENAATVQLKGSLGGRGVEDKDTQWVAWGNSRWRRQVRTRPTGIARVPSFVAATSTTATSATATATAATSSVATAKPTTTVATFQWDSWRMSVSVAR